MKKGAAVGLFGACAFIAITAECVSSNKLTNSPVGKSAVNNQPSGNASVNNAVSTPPTTLLKVAHVGSTLTVSGDNQTADMTLAQVIDPAQGADQYTTSDAGKRFVGVNFVIAATAGTLSGDANNDANVTGSDNQTYNADFSNIVGCTNFSSGSYTIAQGSTSTGCVIYQIPTGVKVSKVQFSLSGGFGGTAGEWLVP